MGRAKKVYTERVCDNPDCAKKFMPTKAWQIYCEPNCRIDRFSEQRVARIEKQVKELEEYKFMYEGLAK